MIFTEDEARKEYNHLFNDKINGHRRRTISKKLRNRGVIGVSFTNEDIHKRMSVEAKDLEKYEHYVKQPTLLGKSLLVLFPKKDGGYFGFKNPFSKNPIKNMRLPYKDTDDIIMFDGNLNRIKANAVPTSGPTSTGTSEQPAPTVETSSEQQTGETTKTQTRQSTPEQPVINRQAEAQIEKPSIQKQFREKFPLKSEPKPEPSKAVKAGFFSEKASISNFDENFSLTNARKRQLLETKWNKTLDEISPGAKRYTDKSMKRAMEKFSNDYNLGVDLSNYKTSMLGRIANRVRGNKNISKEEALERTLGAYSKKTNEYINNLKEQYQSGKITDRQYMRRANRGWTRAAANGGKRVPKSRNLEKLGWKGKAGAAAALLALGGVIGNQFSGGHQSNAQLYNPNPQPQYAN